jgi:hypothetical protein
MKVEGGVGGRVGLVFDGWVFLRSPFPDFFSTVILAKSRWIWGGGTFPLKKRGFGSSKSCHRAVLIT